MKKTLLKLLTGLTAVSLTVAQPVSVLASETDGAACEQTEQNNQEFGESNDQISDGGNNDSNTDNSASNDGAEGTGDAANNNSAAVADGVDNTDDTIKTTEDVVAEENKAIDTTQQTGGANSDLIGEAEQSDGEQPEETPDDEQTDNPIEETTEGEKETAVQSLSNSDMEVAYSAENASDANTVTTDDSQSGANVASDIAKYDESAEEKKDNAGEEKVNAAEETEMTAVIDIDSESALPTNSNNAVLSQMMTESLSEDNATRSVDDQQATCVAAVTKKSGTQYYNTLQEAIDAADEDDTTITLVKEVKENVIISGKNVKNFVLDLCGKTITSVENAAKACIDIVGSKVTIRNTGAEKNEDGTLKNASVTGSTASGIKISQSSVDLFGLLIKGNVGSLGGGVQASDSELNITGTTFADNKATGVNAHGGAIATYKGKLNIDGSTFTGNSADTNGGAVYTREAGSVNISNSDFSANKAYNGGAYASETSQAPYDTTTEVNITNVTICGNEATNLGGGLCFNGYDSASGVSFLSGKGKNHSVTVTASTISGNAAGQQGGGVLAYGADLTIDGKGDSSTVIDNNTAIYGGGVFSFHSDVKIGKGTVISGNTALSYGGGLYSSFDTSYKMNGVTVDDNTATVNYGGGVFTYGTQGVEVVNSSIKNNKARLGGGLAAYASGVNMSGSFVTGNKGIIYTDANGTAWNASGAGILVCSKGVVNLVNTAVTGNGDENTSTGGAAAVYSGSKLTADANTTIMNNSAVLGGGLYISGEATIFNGAKLYNNTAVTAGDDVYLAPGAAITLTPVGKKWVLNDGYGHIIDGWYIDAKDARWSETVAKGLEGYLAEGVTITLNKDGSYTIKVAANAKSGFALKAAHSPIKPTPNTPSTPAETDGATATAADAHAVLGAVRTPEVVENVIEESAVLGVERTSTVLGALRGRGTGDESHMGAWGVVSLVSLVGVGVFFARKKKED